MVLSVLFADKIDRDLPGFYVDVGAYHPQKCSNTYYFYQQGWRGINIEPLPGRIEQFQQTRPEDINLDVGISEREQTLTYYGLDWEGMGSFSQTKVEEFVRQGRTIKFQAEVPTYPLQQILDQYLPTEMAIDFLDVDVEGLDLEVLRSNDWSRYRPKVILAEDLDDSGEIIEFLQALGYTLKAKLLFTLIFSESL